MMDDCDRFAKVATLIVWGDRFIFNYPEHSYLIVKRVVGEVGVPLRDIVAVTRDAKGI